MKIVSWNVNGIRACYKKGLLDFIHQEKPDILCLQETKAHLEQVEPALHTLGYRYGQWSSAQRKGYSGVATFYNQENVSTQIGFGLDHSTDPYALEGRCIITQHPDFALYNIYFPNGGSGQVRHDFKQVFLRDLHAHLQSQLLQGKGVVVVGDYNIAHQAIDVYDPVRLSTASGFLPEERQWFSEFLQSGFIDTFRHFHPDAKDRYSWWSYRELARIGNRGWRIDYICTSQNLQKRLQSAEILDQVEGSDHCPVVLELS